MYALFHQFCFPDGAFEKEKRRETQGCCGFWMAAIRSTTRMIFKQILHPSPILPFSSLRRFSKTPKSPLSLAYGNGVLSLPRRGIGFSVVRCAASDADNGGKKVSARLSQVQQLLQEAEEQALSFDSGPTPKITLGAPFLLIIVCLITEKLILAIFSYPISSLHI